MKILDFLRKASRPFFLLVDGLIAVLFISIVLNTFNSWLIYKIGSSFFELHFEILFYLILIRAASFFPWKRFLEITLPKKGFVALAAVVFVAFMHNLIMVNLFTAVDAIIMTRAAFKGATDDEIAIDITDWNRYYPRQRFILEINDTVPEGEGIAYIGDQRAHIMSYLIYPRKLYALPRMQRLLNQSIQDNWTWSHLEDPFHPQEDPLHPRMQGDYSITEPNEEIQRLFAHMILMKDIKWVVYYDSIFPDKSWLHRIPEGWAETQVERLGPLTDSERKELLEGAKPEA